jgi:predicted AlkP superfamily phosphohydrolase/phosphomutase/tetratricopeptide (TPR) repeat protein
MKAKRVLLIGWDAADWKVIDQLMARGHMPTLQSMVKNGVRGNLSTLQPVLSPMLWSSIATGKFADKHGIHGFTEPDYEGGSIRPISSRSRKARAIWNILTHQGKKSNVFSWWPSNPAEPINGIMVSNLYQRANKPLADGWPMLPGTVHPEDKERLFKRCRVHPDELTSAHILPFIPNAQKIDQENDKRIGALSKMIADAASVHAASTWAMENTEWDFTAVYHDAIDHSCHGFMKFREPRMPGVPEDLFQNYKDVVDGMYRFHDMMLERCLSLAGPDTNVILISDHGFQSDHLRPLSLPQEPAAPAAEHRQHGIICCYGPDFKKGHTIYGSSILDITPTLLTLFGLPVGKDMDGTPLLQAFEEVPPVKSIDSWEKVEGHFGEHDRDHKVNPEDAKAALKQLVELGYIDDPGEDVKKAMKNTAIELKYNLSKVYASTGRPKQALELLEEILKEKDEYRFRIRIAENLKRLERYEDALKMLDEIEKMLQAERKKTNERLKDKSAEEQTKKEEEKDDKVKSELAQLKKQKAENKKRFMSIELLMVDIYKSQKEFEKAIERLQKLSDRAPNSISVIKSAADCLTKMEKWKDARNAYISILNIDPHDHSAHRGLAFCNNKLGKYEESVESALTATELVYQYPAAHFILGDSLYHLGQDEYAAKSLEVALAMRPAYTAPRILLDKMEREGRYSKSEGSSITVEEMDSGSIDQQLQDIQDKSAGIKSFAGRKHGEITVVSGLPRSGTSLMMQMLNAGGMEIYTDEVREADENNPKGFFEHEKVKRLAANNVWIKEAQGKVLKVVSQLTKFLPPNHNYKVVVMKRDIGEVTLSQHKMLVRLGKAKQSDSYPIRLENTLKAQYEGAKKWMEAQDHVDFIEVDYHETLEHPAATAEKVQAFLGQDLNIDAMINQVDKGLYRSKAKK